MKIRSEKVNTRVDRKTFLYGFILIILCLGLNVLLSFIARKLNYQYFPLYFDCVGTVIATLLGGVLPGVIVGIATNMLNGLFASHILLDACMILP